jgi:threonine dehydratase
MSTGRTRASASQQGDVPSADGIAAARARLSRYLRPTPLFKSEALSRAFGADIWLKVEATSTIASFKLRGALNALLHVQEKNGAVGRAITSSTGNHGQGVALAAAWLGIPADIFVPETAEAVKRVMIRLFGGELHVEGHDLDDAKERARAFARSNNGVFVDDGEDVRLIEGAGTVGAEIAETLEKIDYVFSPMGSGSLASGLAIGVKALQPSARIIAVQSTGSPAMVESFRARRIIERPVNTIAGSLVCRVPAHVALNALIEHVDECDLVDDSDLLASVHTLAAWGHVLVEPGAGAGLAAAWKRRRSLEGRTIVLVLTGANIDAETLQKALAAPPLFDQSAFRL